MTAVLSTAAGAILVAGSLLVVAGLFPALAPAAVPHRTGTTSVYMGFFRLYYSQIRMRQDAPRIFHSG